LNFLPHPLPKLFTTLREVSTSRKKAAKPKQIRTFAFVMNSEKSIRIGGNHSPVIISTNPEKDFKRWWQLTVGSHKNTPVIVIVDAAVHAAHQLFIEKILKSIPATVSSMHILPGGESCKSLKVAETLLSEWVQKSLNRDTVVVCIGGGTITDLGGFLASVYNRGLRSVYIPTTLLAMTDAALGGKNALNLLSAKNQIGTIHFPLYTFVTTTFLSTLPGEEMKSGYVEMMKHAVLNSGNFIRQISSISNPEAPPDLKLLIRSIHVKMKIVQADPLESKSRFLLNLGHTFGHAYESCFADSGQPVSHGHAVALGLAEILFISKNHYGFNAALAEEISEWLRLHFSSCNLPDWTMLSPYVLKDKKKTSDHIRLVVMRKPSAAEIIETNAAFCEKAHNDFLADLQQPIFQV